MNNANNPKILQGLKDYELALVTTEFKYYINPQNGEIKMFNKTNELISDNFLAENSFAEDSELVALGKLKAEFISEEALYSAKENLE